MRHCPDLAEIGLFIADAAGSERDLRELPVSKKVVSLKLYHSKIGPKQYSFVAMWIRRMFPYVKTISRWGMQYTGLANGWHEEYEQVWDVMMKTQVGIVDIDGYM